MASVNKVIIIGNMGRDPEIRYTPSGMAVCNISVATSSYKKNRDTGEREEDTQWHRVVVYDRAAEYIGEYSKKGTNVYVEGRLKYGKYTDNNGNERNTVDIVADEIKILSGGVGRDGDTRQQSGGNRSASTGQQNQQRRAPAPSQQGRGFEDMDDDIPFN